MASNILVTFGHAYTICLDTQCSIGKSCRRSGAAQRAPFHRQHLSVVRPTSGLDDLHRVKNTRTHLGLPKPPLGCSMTLATSATTSRLAPLENLLALFGPSLACEALV
jgi:hypothetical protein